MSDRPGTWQTAEEYARVLNVNPATIRRNGATLGGLRVGRVWRFPPDATVPTTMNTARRGYSAKANGTLK